MQFPLPPNEKPAVVSDSTTSNRIVRPIIRKPPPPRHSAELYGKRIELHEKVIYIDLIQNNYGHAIRFRETTRNKSSRVAFPLHYAQDIVGALMDVLTTASNMVKPESNGS